MRLVRIRPHRLNGSPHRDDSKVRKSICEPVGSYRVMKRAFYSCSEFASQLISVFSTTCNVPCTPPFIKQTQDHLLVYKRSTIICGQHMQKGDANQIHIQEEAPYVQLSNYTTTRHTPADVPIDNPTPLGPAAVPNLL